MGYKIRECRKERSMSQCELAEKSGVSRTIISGLENGTITTTTTDTLLKIAKALDKKVADIFFWGVVQHVEYTILKPEGGETDGREDTKNMHEIILASTNCMDTLCTGQDNGWFRPDYIRCSEIFCNGYEIAWN